MTLSRYEYEVVRRAAERTGRTLASVAQDAVAEYCVKPGSKERRLRAIAEVAAAEPVGAPEDLEAWKREYSAMKAGWGCGSSREEFLRIAGPPDAAPGPE